MSKKTVYSMLATGFAALTLLSASAYSTAGSTIPDPYGIAANGAQVDRVIRIDASTRSLQIMRFETIRFEFADGRPSVQWYFDTLGHPVFKLSEIVPNQSGKQDVTLYVTYALSDRG